MRKNGLEWTVFGAGLALLVALVGYLGLLASQGGPGEASFRVSLGKPEKVEGGYRTRVTVENAGEATTRAVRVEVGKAELDLDYVPRRSTREGFVVTDEPPKAGSVASWQAP